jgi:hypothetical protein
MKSLFSVPVQSLCAASLLLFVVGACADRNQALVQGASDPDLVTYSVEIKADASKLSPAEALLLSQINSKKQVSFSDVTDLAQLAIEEDYRNGQEESDELGRNILSARERINSIVPLGLNELSPAEIKVRLEEGLRGYFAGDLEYDVARSSMLDPLLDNVAQCYSGTMLFTQVARRIPGQTYRAKNFVTIFTSGHVLPGYAKSTGNGYELYGIETTQSGRAEKFYGNVDALPQGTVVVDADYFLLTEIFKGRLENACEVQNKIIELTAVKYGINRPQGRCDPAIASASSGTAFARGGLFSFGTPTTPPGRRSRAASGEGIENLAVPRNMPMVGNAVASRRGGSAGSNERIYFSSGRANFRDEEKVYFVEGESLSRAHVILRNLVDSNCESSNSENCFEQIIELRELLTTNAKELDRTDCRSSRNEMGNVTALACGPRSGGSNSFHQGISISLSSSYLDRCGSRGCLSLMTGRLSERAEGFDSERGYFPLNQRRYPAGIFLLFEMHFVGLQEVDLVQQ